MPNDIEAQRLVPVQSQRSVARSTALKVGATALCCAALATTIIAALKHQPAHEVDFPPMRMLEGNDTAPCAEFNENGGNYVPFDKSKYMTEELALTIIAGIFAAPCLIGTAYQIVKCMLSTAERETLWLCAGCAALPTAAVGIGLFTYFEYKNMTNGECWEEPIHYGSRG